METLIQIVLSAVSYVEGINPRVVEFILHYLRGTQEDMTLNEEEIEYLTDYVWLSIGDYSGESGSGRYNAMEARGVIYTQGHNWLSHITMGVVGGFDYTLVVKEGRVYAQCIDTWDFNNCDCGLYIPEEVPNFAVLGAKLFLKKLGITIYKDEYGRYLKEEDLVVFNESHKFKTLWEIEVPWNVLEDAYIAPSNYNDAFEPTRVVYNECPTLGFARAVPLKQYQDPRIRRTP